MHGLNWIVIIIAGIFAGWVAERLMNRNHGILTNLVVGVVGSFIGAFVANALGIVWMGLIGSLLISTAGAILLLFLLGLIRR